MYVQESRRWLKHIDFIILDILSLILSFFSAYIIRNGFPFRGISDNYLSLLYLLVLFHVGVILVTENYEHVIKRGHYREFLATLKQTAIMLAVTAVILFASKHGSDYSRLIIFYTFLIYFFVSLFIRILMKTLIRCRIKNSKNDRKLIIITDENRLGQIDYGDLILNIDGRMDAALIVVDKNLTGRTINGIEVVSDRDNMMEYLIRNWVDEIFIDMNPMSDRFNQLFRSLCETGITFHIRIGNYEDGINRTNAIERLGKFRVLTTSIRVISPYKLLVKRIVDIFGSLIGILITCVLSIFVIPAIKAADPGPAFYVSERVGYNGRKFKFYKFRSMYMDADERKSELADKNNIKDGMMFKIDDDPRIIKGVGNFIRRTSIDEFPQFLNVLKGDMSLVGTRPPTIDEWEKYHKNHRSRMCVKPGITGMWQISGRSEITDFEEVVRLDNRYIEDWNYGLDIKILLLTVVRVIKGNGAK